MGSHEGILSRGGTWWALYSGCSAPVDRRQGVRAGGLVVQVRGIKGYAVLSPIVVSITQENEAHFFSSMGESMWTFLCLLRVPFAQEWAKSGCCRVGGG